MRFKSAPEFRKQPTPAIPIMGMSGVGKTTLAVMLQKSGWFQYSVDYRIGPATWTSPSSTISSARR